MTKSLWDILNRMVARISLDVKRCRRPDPISLLVLTHVMRITAQIYKVVPWLTVPEKRLHLLLDQAQWLEALARRYGGIAFARSARRTLSTLQCLVPSGEVSW